MTHISHLVICSGTPNANQSSMDAFKIVVYLTSWQKYRIYGRNTEFMAETLIISATA